MREIKFRGKTKDGDWVYGDLIHRFKDGVNRVDVGYYDTEMNEVIPQTVGQYTGLKDTNGKEIYEGDIVKVLGGEYCQGFHEYNYTCVVEWQANGFDLVKIKNKCGVGWGFVSIEYDITVIGNIYENPELLEVRRLDKEHREEQDKCLKKKTEENYMEKLYKKYSRNKQNC